MDLSSRLAIKKYAANESCFIKAIIFDVDAVLVDTRVNQEQKG
jgi:hypothetical protein